MGRKGKMNGNRRLRKKAKSKSGSSDDSDEDYVVENEDFTSEDDDLEDVMNSFDGYSSDVYVVDDEDMDEEDEVSNTTRCRRRTKNNRSHTVKSKRRKLTLCDIEDEDYVVEKEDEDLYDSVESNDDDVDASIEEEKDEPEKHQLFDKEDIGPNSLSSSGKASRKLRKKLSHSDGSEDDSDYADSSPTFKKNIRSKKPPQLVRRKRYISESDSDFRLSPGSSDCDYTISEEEREQVKEANTRCASTKPRQRKSTSKPNIQENIKRKGKEKAQEKGEQLKAEIVKQVCGICLTEEDKKKSKGILNCCIHYFCFACIMEWSKVESRCPLCKRRFQTITKHGRSANGVDLRNVVIEIPERDQVYQPTEEEIRSFIDPYEHVICTECHQGGDDALMLLCDICDSPAHTYCVGLGRQVPEGNWYCHGCKPVALGSSSTHISDSLFDLPLLVGNTGESSRFVSNRSPRIPSYQDMGIPSPRFPGPDSSPLSPMSGAGAATLSVRRQIHRHIQYLISNRMSYSNSALRTSIQDTRMLENMLLGQPTVNAHSFPLPGAISFVSSRHNQPHHVHMSEPSLQPQALTWPDPPYLNPSTNQFYSIKEQLQSMVKSHLLSMSHDTNLGDEVFAEITRSATHTVLAACGLEHRLSEIQVTPPSTVCSHFERIAAGDLCIMKGFCSSCFDSFVRDVVKKILDTRLPQWLSLGL